MQLRGNYISFSYPGTDTKLLSDVSFCLDDSSKVGIIGKNGCGKTTFFKIILKQLNDFDGYLSSNQKMEIGYLPQELCFNYSLSAYEFLWEARCGLFKLKKQIEEAYECESYNYEVDIFNQYDELGGYDFELNLEKLSNQFEFSDEMLKRSVATFSGGEKTKLALFKVLLKKPNLLLLDEPTNHLDVNTLNWLENYLTKLKMPFMVISHDRVFLDKCVKKIWEIKDAGLREFTGNYSFYKDEIEREEKRSWAEYETQQKKIKQLKKDAMEKRKWAFSYQAETGSNGNAPSFNLVVNPARRAMKRAVNIEKRIELMITKEEKNKPFIEKDRKVMFQICEKSRSKVVLDIRGVTKEFDEVIFNQVDLPIKKGERMAIIGKNGCGKSTLLKIIAGLLNPTKGEVYIPPSTKMAYYFQEYENLDLDNTIIDEVVMGDYHKLTYARTILGSLGIRKDKVFDTIKYLSLGERSKVALVKTILSDANVLVLDEPTNHLEISAREIVEHALENYEGTIIFVTHDRMFLEKFSESIFDMETNTLYHHGDKDFDQNEKVS